MAATHPSLKGADVRVRQELARHAKGAEDALADLKALAGKARARAKAADKRADELRPGAQAWMDAGMPAGDTKGREAAQVYTAAIAVADDARRAEARAMQVIEQQAQDAEV